MVPTTSEYSFTNYGCEKFNMKKCLRCEIAFDTDLFHSRIDKRGISPTIRYQSVCKECNKLVCKERRHSTKGLITDIYSGQKLSAKVRKMHQPAYSREDLEQWLTNQPNFKHLLAEWIKSNYDRWRKPSCDRKDDYKSYTLDNIQLMTWKENATKYCSDSFNGINNKQARPVRQLTLDNKEIAVFHSIQFASRETGCAAGNLLRCCQGVYETSKGFKWEYLNAD